MKVLTFNLWNRPWRRRARMLEAARLIQAVDADIVALQEVATGWLLPGNPLDAITGYPHRVCHWHETNLGVFKTGVALLSRRPITRWRYVEFARHPFWDAKGFLDARIDGVQVIVVHLASTRNDGVREAEYAQLAGEIGEGRTIVLGDFNSTPRLALAMNPPTGPTWRGDTLDYVLARGFSIPTARAIATTASDHFPVLAELARRD